jgi:hypothetical protein
VAVGALLLSLFAVAAYTVGAREGHRLRVLTGNAYVGDHQTSVNVDGWAYGVVASVAWVDCRGATLVR